MGRPGQDPVPLAVDVHMPCDPSDPDLHLFPSKHLLVTIDVSRGGVHGATHSRTSKSQ